MTELETRITELEKQVAILQGKRTPRNDATSIELFSKNFKRLKRMTGKTNSVVAKEIGVGEGVVHCWSGGKYFPRANMLDCIASYFDVPVSDLFIA